jgi:hypothetical protein
LCIPNFDFPAQNISRFPELTGIGSSKQQGLKSLCFEVATPYLPSRPFWTLELQLLQVVPIWITSIDSNPLGLVQGQFSQIEEVSSVWSLGDLQGLCLCSMEEWRLAMGELLEYLNVVPFNLGYCVLMQYRLYTIVIL